MKGLLLELIPQLLAFLLGFILPSPVEKVLKRQKDVLDAEKKADAGDPSDLDKLP